MTDVCTSNIFNMKYFKIIASTKMGYDSYIVIVNTIHQYKIIFSNWIIYQ